MACEPGMCGSNCTEDCGHSTEQSNPEHVDGVCKDEYGDCNHRQSKDSTYINVVCKKGLHGIKVESNRMFVLCSTEKPNSKQADRHLRSKIIVFDMI